MALSRLQAVVPLVWVLTGLRPLDPEAAKRWLDDRRVRKVRQYRVLAGCDPLVVDRAEGATYFSDDGSSFIDCFAGISVVNTGHGNEQVMSAARRQMERLVHCSSYLYHVDVVADLAGVAFAPAPYCYRCPLGLEVASCEMACARAIEDVIAFHTAD